MEQLQFSLERLAGNELAAGEKDRLLLTVERLKAQLREYRLSLRSSDLAAYWDKALLEEEGAYRYISYENQEKYVYDSETGFLTEPKAEVSGAFHV